MFSDDYFQARERFLKAAHGLPQDRLPLSAKGPKGEELTIDLAWLGDPRSDRVLIHSSGIHGVEGFAGSAIQTAALSNKIQPPPGVGLIFVHALNPFGMAWKRRVNENNVDLNRNFLEKHAGAPPAYAAMDGFLNGEPRGFWPQLLINVVRLGFTSFKNAIVQGQYEFPRGLFFGGSQLEEGPRLYKSWLAKNVNAAKFVLALDVHTGLGRMGEEVLFRHGFPIDIGRKITALSETIGYKVNGGLEVVTEEISRGATWSHLTQEFGTSSMIRVLEGMCLENYHFQKTGLPNDFLIQRMNPADAKWRSLVLGKGAETLARALNWLAKR